MKKFFKVLMFIGMALGAAILVKKLMNRKNDDEDVEENEDEKNDL
jgi:hypothetical protein